jgi:hypothetical protein
MRGCNHFSNRSYRGGRDHFDNNQLLVDIQEDQGCGSHHSVQHRSCYGAQGAAGSRPENFDSTKFGHFQNPRGNCSHCGSSFHWANKCDIRRLEDKLQDMELKLYTKQPDWANAIERATEGDITDAEIHAAKFLLPGAPKGWFLDSGTSAHITRARNLLHEVRAVPSSSTITTAGGKSLPIVGHSVTTLEKNKSVDQILYVPSIWKNLLSVGKFADAGYYTLFGPKRCWIFDKNNSQKMYLIGVRDSRNSLYRLTTSTQRNSHGPSIYYLNLVLLPATYIGSPPTIPSLVELWHKCIGHFNYQALSKLSHQNIVTVILSFVRLLSTASPVSSANNVAIQYLRSTPLSKIEFFN